MKKQIIKLGIPSRGRLFDGSISFFKKMDLNLNVKSRKLVIDVDRKNIRYHLFFLRPKDIVRLVELKKLDIGIVGLDSVLESNAKVVKLNSLDFGSCTLVVAKPKSTKIKSISQLRNKTIATSYPNLTLKYFKSLNIPIKLITVNGSVEAMPYLGIADAIVDIVETGKTLKENNLTVLKSIKKFNAVLISNKKSKFQYLEKYI